MKYLETQISGSEISGLDLMSCRLIPGFRSGRSWYCIFLIELASSDLYLRLILMQL